MFCAWYNIKYGKVMTRYTLDKMSMPGWTFKSDHLHHILWMLDKHVCGNCKWTREDYATWRAKGDPEIIDEDELLEDGINPYTLTDFIPENYSELSEQEKINWLMSTACGCEFDFIDNEDPNTGKTFVEIGNEK